MVSRLLLICLIRRNLYRAATALKAVSLQDGAYFQTGFCLSQKPLGITYPMGRFPQLIRRPHL